ncbi:unnamed protein product [Rhizophagus irregularis]|nr:unnamed protein product [Rhizophagus irregularis]
MPSLQGVSVEDGELKMDIYEKHPLIYTSINSEDNELKIDTCVNFPVVEIVYDGDLLESFLKYTDDEKNLHELYGDCFARKVLAGGQLFIIDFNSATQTQVDILKFYLLSIYNSAKYSIEIQFNNLFPLDLLPKLITLDGEKINTHEKLTNWMNNLYRNRMVNIISYEDLISISQLKHNISFVDSDLETFKEKQPGVSNFKEKLSLDEWVGDAINNNLMTWTRDFNLFQGLIINKYDEIEISEKIPVNVIKIPIVNSNNTSYLKIIKPSTKFEFTLTSNNIFSIKNLSTFPFVKNSNKSYDGYNHIQVKCEKYEILLNMDNVKPTKEFEQVIEEALNSMKPLKALQDVFNEYGHLFPQRIILGRSLKNVTRNFSTFDDVNDNDKILESLNNLNIPYLLTQEGKIIEKNDLHNWIQNMNNHLEIIEFDDIIPLYKILKVNQQEKIDDILKNNYRIIMTGITDLTDLNHSNDNENYKRINFGLSLKSEDYEVFGSIISENNIKLEEVYVNFGLYDFNGFYAIIKKLEETSIDITKCYVSWVIIGKPSQLSIFSPNNRELQVDYIKKSIKLKSNEFNYDTIGTSFTLNKGYIVFAHINHSSIGNENNNIIKLVEWKENSIDFQIESAYNIQPNVSSPNSDSDHEDNDCLVNEVDLRICIISTNYKNLKIDNTNERNCSLDLIGHILNEKNFNGSLSNKSDENEVSVNIQNNDSIISQSLDIEPEPNDKGILSKIFLCYLIVWLII